MTAEKSLYTIVVIGAMNPRIHHPAWYRLVGLSSEEEEKNAENAQLICSTQVSQFRIGEVVVSCQQDRWEIRTENPQLTNRLQDITAKVFDELLQQTPVSQFGFNFNHQKHTKCPNVARLLSEIIIKMPFGLRNGNSVGIEMRIHRQLDIDVERFKGVRNQVVLNSLPDAPTDVFVANNYDYLLPPQGYFKIGEYLSTRYSPDRLDAEEQTKNIVDSINSCRGLSDGNSSLG